MSSNITRSRDEHRGILLRLEAADHGGGEDGGVVAAASSRAARRERLQRRRRRAHIGERRARSDRTTRGAR